MRQATFLSVVRSNVRPVRKDTIVHTLLKDRHYAVLGSTVMVDQSTVQHAKQAIIVQTQKVKYQFLKGVSCYGPYTTEGHTMQCWAVQ